MLSSVMPYLVLQVVCVLVSGIVQNTKQQSLNVRRCTTCTTHPDLFKVNIYFDILYFKNTTHVVLIYIFYTAGIIRYMYVNMYVCTSTCMYIHVCVYICMYEISIYSLLPGVPGTCSIRTNISNIEICVPL